MGNLETRPVVRCVFSSESKAASCPPQAHKVKAKALISFSRITYTTFTNTSLFTMKSTMITMLRTATTAARRQTHSTLARSCRPPGNTTTSPTRKLSRTRKAGGACLLAAPSFLLTPTDSMIYDDDADTAQTANLSNKASLTSSNSLLTSQDSLKDSFDAFLHSIEPLIHRRMSVGVSSIPHPAKIAKGGEDAYFLSTDMKVMGVADGMHHTQH
jgi:hypothetical protein